MSVRLAAGVPLRSARRISVTPTYYFNKLRSSQRFDRLGRIGKGSPDSLSPVLGNLYGMQIGRIQTKNNSRLKKTESKPANQGKIPLSDHQSSEGKFRVCQARQQEERRSERTHRNQETKGQSKQERIHTNGSARSIGNQQYRASIARKRRLSRTRAGAETSAQGQSTVTKVLGRSLHWTKRLHMRITSPPR